MEKDGADDRYAQALDDAAGAVRTLYRGALDLAMEHLVGAYAREIHNPFSPGGEVT